MSANTRRPLVRPFWMMLAPVAVAVGLLASGAGTAPTKTAAGEPQPTESSNAAISPENQAAALHQVIAADRAVCCEAWGTWCGGPGDPRLSPCEMLRRASDSIQRAGAEFSYALRSLNPTEVRNGPQTELEREGLRFIASHPGENYTGREMLGGRRYFTAVYPDLPATASCVDCHQRRAGAGGRRNRAGEVLGGIVVRVPLEF